MNTRTMRAGSMGALALMALGLLGLEACNDCQCGDCPFSSVVSEARAAEVAQRTIRAAVATEGGNALVVTLTMSVGYSCQAPTMESLYFRLDATTGRLEPSATG